MKTRKPSKAQAVKWRLDLFGEMPVSREDVYAWLIAVVDMDPASKRAFRYVRDYGVLNRIIRAKIDGTFDELVAPAKHSGRLIEMASAAAVDLPSNHLGLGDFGRAVPQRLGTEKLAAPRRPAEVIQRERERIAAGKRARREVDATMLRRFPKAPPPLSTMLADIGSPPPEALAGAFGVTAPTVRRWVREDRAPLPVLFALFWLTRWGTSEVDAKAHNDAVMAAREASRLRNEVESLRARLNSVGRIADFGSANDPHPGAPAGIAAPGYAVPPDLPARREVPIIFTSMRRVPCADSGRAKKRA